ncbi:hypothetical protein [uncultured Sphingomonas sp.]|uniref:hypothetical protein n=1 Tax=uncultured Sphingomonas sp. TaxID=158754 RepID=UPI0025FA79C3|nr:hypothetical protein [uncultured Sphingomonas sp.]
MLPIFPAHLLNPDSVTPRLDRRTISGGVALSGDEDVIATDGGGRVVVEYGDMASDDPAMQRLLNQWDGYLAGGAALCLVPIVSFATAPRVWHGNAPRPSFAIAANDPVFPTSVAFQVRTIAAVNVGATALRATTISIRVDAGSPIVGGEWFGTGERVHSIVRVVSRSGSTAVCQIRPPLRAALPDGAPLEFEWPVVKARVTPGASLVPQLAYGMFGDVGAVFREAP